ncbi:uncharacterized protein FOMMEDRAFT_151160 [Fomitiporia mediterranea MF3/22]|uniref:uncharacterized protein n=1 Tax=Fomitiporia mediterranea (strain MF3/22) TaxID=694068 RepID=UPI0004408AB5|nr:uncharacterized protein FOMMEDRAFT_151160 [Fomitiporia mediterranea MF3/22]EJD08364.1 hypothetical protein FOMMEDRAFT_151160 [Fomitiporia mediterranea MF3/22]
MNKKARRISVEDYIQEAADIAARRGYTVTQRVVGEGIAGMPKFELALVRPDEGVASNLPKPLRRAATGLTNREKIKVHANVFDLPRKALQFKEEVEAWDAKQRQKENGKTDRKHGERKTHQGVGRKTTGILQERDTIRQEDQMKPLSDRYDKRKAQPIKVKLKERSENDEDWISDDDDDKENNGTREEREEIAREVKRHELKRVGADDVKRLHGPKRIIRSSTIA